MKPIMAQIAPGELLDKITILEIKRARITDPAKLRNINVELATLLDAWNESLPSSEKLGQLASQLRSVNEALWQIEDDIRLCERAGDFGPRFIALARSVYQQNDQRSALKRQINELLQSPLVEEKSYASYDAPKTIADERGRQPLFLGIEIGGTKLQLGLGPGDGTLAALWRGSVDIARGGEGIREQIIAQTPALLQSAGVSREQIQGVGVGFGGPVDDADQTVIKSHQIQGWDGFPLAKWLTDLLGWPVALGNDADVAGLAEALFGAGKGLSPIFYITIGSGIGGGLIINGEIYRGCGRGAAEIGHVGVAQNWLDPIWLDHGKPNLLLECYSPGFVPLETVASGWAIGLRAQQLAQNGFDADSPLFRLVLGNGKRISALHVGQAAADHDRLAQSVLEWAWRYLAQAIAMMIALQCPRRIIIGGGVSLMGEQVLFEPLRTLVAERVFQPFANCYDIVPAALGEEVVVHGALALALSKWRVSG